MYAWVYFSDMNNNVYIHICFTLIDWPDRYFIVHYSLFKLMHWLMEREQRKNQLNACYLSNQICKTSAAYPRLDWYKFLYPKPYCEIELHHFVQITYYQVSVNCESRPCTFEPHLTIPNSNNHKHNHIRAVCTAYAMEQLYLLMNNHSNDTAS